LRTSATTLAGDPKAVILDRGGQLPADLIVVGSHGSAVARFLLGNVATNVVLHATCPVEIVRARPGLGPLRKVLLATDGSEFSEAAARWVASQVWPENTEIRVLSVVEFVLSPARAFLEPPYFHSTEVDQGREEAMRHAQAAVASAFAILTPACPNVSESISVLLSGPRQVILDEARQWDADLIVVGSHGRGGLDRFLMGSVSEAVAIQAPCSVAVVRR
jgi:nucleotide-binding universal stress UspA family protein